MSGCELVDARGADAQAPLVACMAAAVFEQLVKTGAPCPAAVDGPSPLHAVDAAKFLAWGEPQEQPIPVWSATLPVALEPGVVALEAMRPNGRTRQLVILRDEKVERELELTPDLEWIANLFVRLAADDTLTVGRLRRALRIPAAMLDDVLTICAGEEWVMVPAPNRAIEVPRSEAVGSECRRSTRVVDLLGRKTPTTSRRKHATEDHPSRRPDPGHCHRFPKEGPEALENHAARPRDRRAPTG